MVELDWLIVVDLVGFSCRFCRGVWVGCLLVVSGGVGFGFLYL